MPNRLKELRQKNNLTLKELGKKIDIPNNSLSQYENGKREPKLEIWEKLANFYGVSVPYLQGYEQPTPHYRLKELRQERGLSQEDLAKSVGITRQAISNYELGLREPSPAIWRQLAVYFGKPVTYLKGEIDTKKIYKIIKAIMLLSQPEINLTLDEGQIDSAEAKKSALAACFISIVKEINYDPVKAIDEVKSKLQNGEGLDDDTRNQMRKSMDYIQVITDMTLEQCDKI